MYFLIKNLRIKYIEEKLYKLENFYTPNLKEIKYLKDDGSLKKLVIDDFE